VQFTVVDLFAAPGGLSEGFAPRVFKIVAAIDCDEYMLKTYKFNHPETKVVCKDIRKVTAQDLLENTGFCAGEIDVLVGGPPCEGFSTVGYRREDDPRNSLFWEFLRLADEIKPRVILI